jgi:hypothetical protein
MLLPITAAAAAPINATVDCSLHLILARRRSNHRARHCADLRVALSVFDSRRARG